MMNFKLNGKPVPPGKFGSEFRKAAEEEINKNLPGAIQKEVEQSLADLICEEHGETPKVTDVDLDNMKVHIEGCCQDLIDRANARLAESE